REGTFLMKSIAILMFCIAPAVWAQAPAAMTPETVVAQIDGKPVTAGELMLVLQMSPPEAQKNLLKDSKMFLESFGLIRKLAEIKDAIFALKPGNVTDALRVPSGFYLFRLEESTVQSYDTVRDDIFIEIQQKRFNEWQERMVKSLNVKIVNENFFSKTAASAT